MIIRENILKAEGKGIISNKLIPLDIANEEFKMLMSLYNKAELKLLETLNFLKEYLREIYDYDVINNIVSRIKTPASIINKMKKKGYEITYENLINNINDIAGIRIICTFKNDISKIRDIILNMPNVRILKEKDYLTKSKRSGYTGYHIILETDVEYEGEKYPMKVEIQLRSMAMDFWSTLEHKIKYKSKHKLSNKDSKKLQVYAKVINIIEDKMIKIYQKQLK